jgi:hypothetical protein
MHSIGEQILIWLGQQAEGTVVSAKGLLHLGGRAAVDQALARLARQGQLQRVGRGRYVLPIKTRFGVRSPAPEKVAASLARTTGETIVPSGASTAHGLGLTTQVPIRHVFLTSGRGRTLRLGGETVEFRHAPGWQLLKPETSVGQAVRAMAWLGERQAPAAARKLRNKLSAPERSTLADLRSAMPTWLARTVSETFVSGS